MTVFVPEVEVFISDEEPAPPIGSAGVVIYFGDFERAKEGKKYHIKTLKQARALLGQGYTGNKAVELLFTKHEDPNSPTPAYISKGVTKVIAYQLGTRTGATVTLKDDESTPENTLKLTFAGGKFGNNKTIRISEGNISGQTVSILDGDGTVLKSYVDCKDKKELIRRLKKDPTPLITEIEDLSPDVNSLANVSSASFTGGSEDNTVTNDVLISALEAFEEIDADFIGTSATLPYSGYELICNWADTKEKANSPILPVLQVSQSLNYAEKRQLGIDLPTKNRWLIDGIANDYNEVETTALIIGLAAGMKVKDSPDFPIISSINYVEPIYKKQDKIDLTDAGITVFNIRNEESNQYGLNLAVTGEQRILDNGNKHHYMHVYAVRSLHYLIKYLNLDSWLKRTDVTATPATADGELAKRMDEVRPDVVKKGEAKCSVDNLDDPRELNIFFKAQIGAILLKVNLYMDLTLFQGG